jgi:predicted transglutaminase-like cysteine proteinase
VGIARQLPLAERLRRINRIVNSANYAPDMELWGKADYWATPGELFGRGGDCEDFATAKFLMLRDTGVPSSQMFVLVLHAGFGGAAHAVLIVETEDGPRVLDNLRNRIYPLSGSMARRTAFAINDKTMWVPLAWARSSALPKPAQDGRSPAQ